MSEVIVTTEVWKGGDVGVPAGVGRVGPPAGHIRWLQQEPARFIPGRPFEPYIRHLLVSTFAAHLSAAAIQTRVAPAQQFVQASS